MRPTDQPHGDHSASPRTVARVINRCGGSLEKLDEEYMEFFKENTRDTLLYVAPPWREDLAEEFDVECPMNYCPIGQPKSEEDWNYRQNGPDLDLSDDHKQKIGEAIEQAVESLRGAEQALSWLSREQHQFDGRIPFELLFDVNEIEEVLIVIEWIGTELEEPEKK